MAKSSTLRFPKPESRALKYGYANARVKAMKGLMLKAGFLDELIKVKSVGAMVELLQRTHYKDELVALSLSYKGSELIELASGRHFLKVAGKVRKLCPKDDVPALESLLKKWDILNLQYIINARKVGKTYDEIKSHIVPAGGISTDDYERISKCDEDKMPDEIRRTGFGRRMFSELALLAQPRWQGKLSGLQAMLDAYFHTLLEKSLSIGSTDTAGIVKILKNEVDAKNILFAERLKLRGMDKSKIKEHLLRGGTLGTTSIAELANAKDLQAAVKMIKPKLSGFEAKGGEITLSELEVALEKFIAMKKLNLFRRSVLSIGVLLGFIMLKEEEINNIRKIATAKEYGMSEQETREMLVMVQ